MNSSDSEGDQSRSEQDSGDGYSLEILAGITGISIQTIHEYQVHGIIRAASCGDRPFDDEAVRLLRRVQHVRETCEMNLSGLKLLASLLNELDQLRAELRGYR